MTAGEMFSMKALQILDEDAHRIETLIQVQMEHVTTRKCPLYEEVLDTQLYGFSRAVDFAVRIGLLDAHIGKERVMRLERTLIAMHQAMERAQQVENE